MLDTDSLPIELPGTESSTRVDRMQALVHQSRHAAERVEALCELALRGLPKMYAGAGMFVQTVRGIETDGERVLHPEGDNLRYAAIVALGLSCLDEATQRQILRGHSAADLALISAERAADSPDIGAVALSAWAAAEVADHHAAELFEMLAAQLAPGRPIETVACAWALTAALAARHGQRIPELVSVASARLLAGQGEGGAFPKVLPAQARGWGRAHVGCFADQVYPVQALARLYAARGDAGALAAAEACADNFCARQGNAGQWWWHYDTRDGSVVEGYPVYSVHQHAMAPLALLDLWEASGDDRWWPPIISGLDWIDRHPESPAALVSDRDGVVWRKIGRREPAKATRSISALTTGLRRGWHLPGLDAVFPPNQVDYECRPYEFGWLLYAWRSSGAVRSLFPNQADHHG